MARKCLGQANPAASTWTDLYPVPASKSATVSTVSVSNDSDGEVNFQIRHAIGGASGVAAQNVTPVMPVGARDRYSATEGWSMAATDVLRVWASGSAVTFIAWGDES